MAEPFICEIRIFSFNFAPKGWAQCNGQLLPINQNQALFALLGTTYGGNGQTTFGLPDLRGRTPIHFGSGHTLGEKGGTASVTLSNSELPAHTHLQNARTEVVPVEQANQDPTGKFLASAQLALQGGFTSPVSLYTQPVALTALNPASISTVGGSQAHTNMMPFSCINFCISLTGVFPSPN